MCTYSQYYMGNLVIREFPFKIYKNMTYKVISKNILSHFCTVYDHLILVILFKNRHKDFFACLASMHALGRGPFNNYVDKIRVGGVKKCLFLSTLKV